MVDHPNCYECQHQDSNPGTAHIRCRHPKIKEFSDDIILGLANAVSGSFGAFKEAVQELGITADGHGIRKGWFTWPWDFDPVWLRSCNGYEARELVQSGKDGA